MISVVTPVYNAEKFIKGCILNVIEQNCTQVEHIIVDGKSTDKTVDIIKEYADKYEHIRWISEKDDGQSDAMNKGIAMAKGEILSFLNVDDYYSPNVLNRVLELFQSLPEPTLLVGNCNMWDKEGNIYAVNKPNNLNYFDLLTSMYINYDIQLPNNPSAYFYHTSLHKDIGLYKVDEDYVLDLDFILRAVKSANTLYVDEDFGNYRYIPNSKTFEDVQRGENHNRVIKLLKDYRNNLPIHLRIKIFLLEIKAKFKYILWKLNLRRI